MISRLSRTTLLVIASALFMTGCSTMQAQAPATVGQSSSQPTTIQQATTAIPSQQVSTAQPSQPSSTPAVQAQANTAAACSTPATLTPAVTEGPYFKAGSPERASLVTSSTPGTQLVLTGYVLTADCKPVAHALLDFWQADANGNYDNSGYTLRGHQFTDASGKYTLTTIVPGLYPGRTEHIHVKVQAPNGPILTTQLFFPGVTNNESDGIYNPALLITVQSSGASMAATFNFVVSSQ